MSSVVISGDTSGAITLAVPAVAGTNTITLPASTGTVLTTGSPQSGGVIQTVNFSYSSQTTTSSSSFVTTNLTTSITPRFSTSKILVTCAFPQFANSINSSALYTLYRGGTNLGTGTYSCLLQNYCTSTTSNYLNASIVYLDNPATTSSTTYTVYMASLNGSSTIGVFQNGVLGTITLQEIAA